MTPRDLARVIDALGELPYGLEPVDQRAHALQCAAQAIDAGADDELVAAAALHDVGRAPSVGPRYPSLPHEAAGARWARPALGERVAWLVAAHVPAKRYLVATDAGYAAALSPASTHSLEVQGGPLSGRGLDAFAAHPWCADAVALRRWDEGAKVPGAATPEPDDLVPWFERLLR